GGGGGAGVGRVGTRGEGMEQWRARGRGCGRGLGEGRAGGHQKRQVLDLRQRVVEVTEHRAHSCWCPRCGTETQAPLPVDVRAATQYGPIVGALVVYLQAWQLIPEDRLAELMRDVFGVEVATATIAAMGQRKAQEFAGLAEQIEQHVKDGAVKHMDETGYRIAGLAGQGLSRRVLLLVRTRKGWQQRAELFGG